jgi:hypothetical protein
MTGVVDHVHGRGLRKIEAVSIADGAAVVQLSSEIDDGPRPEKRSCWRIWTDSGRVVRGVQKRRRTAGWIWVWEVAAMPLRFVNLATHSDKRVGEVGTMVLKQVSKSRRSDEAVIWSCSGCRRCW